MKDQFLSNTIKNYKNVVLKLFKKYYINKVLMFYIFMSKMEATYIIVPLTQMQKIQAHNDSTKHLKNY